MVSYDGWEREHKLNSDDYHAILDDVMSKLCTDSVPRLEQEQDSFVGRKHAVM